MQSPGNTNEFNTSRVAFLGLMTAVALILSYVESLFPFNFGVPGIKLGLPNLTTVILLYVCGPVSALSVNLVRVLLSGLLFGNLSMIIYSLAGAAISFVFMLTAFKINKFSVAGISLIGGVFHNIGQCIVACLVVSNYRIGVYLPFLLIAGALTGVLIGYISKLIIPIIKKIWRN